MDASEVKSLIEAQLPDCEIHVQGDGSHYDIAAIGDVFEGLRPVKKQQLVYAALSDGMGLGLAAMASIGAGLAAVWALIGNWLGGMFRRQEPVAGDTEPGAVSQAS